MGGSAIGGDMLKALVSRRARASVTVVRGYDLPAFVDEKTLVVACSHSGETEEVLAAFSKPPSGPAKKAVITGGGPLAALAREREIPAFIYSYQGEPRSALGYSLMPLLSIAEQTGLLKDPEGDITEATERMADLGQQIDSMVITESNPAKQLAQHLVDRIPVVYGAEHLVPVTRRWKTQFNETSKVWAFHEELPEANHNSIVGYVLPREMASRIRVVFLFHPGLHPRLLLRYEGSQEALESAGVDHDVVEVSGSSSLSQVMTGVLYGDYVSYYLAILNGVSPSPTRAIDSLKKRLAAEPWQE
jgi:glucose/mannose-6-phosphate isomerase